MSVPLRPTIPTGPGVLMWLGMMPTLHCPGVTIPGQLAPSSWCPLRITNSRARIMSCTGISSVMHTVNSIPAAADSMIASAANAGGTKIPETSAPVAATASATVSKIGTPSWSLPPLPGETPATMLVPKARICPV